MVVKAEHTATKPGLWTISSEKGECDVDLDVKDVGTYLMSGEDDKKRILNMIARRGSFQNCKMAELAKRVVKIRVVAWKKGL